jgi:hypothetical protein
MRTLTDATLFVVDGPRGAYFAVRENETGAVLTERTETAAMSMANEKDLLVVDRREIGHAEMLALMASRYQEQAGV